MLESRYQAKLIGKLKDRFPSCVVFKMDPSYIQGTLDLLILWNERWAMLEVKASAKSRTQPNQPYYVDLYNRMSFAAFIYPENEEDVLNALQQSFGL